MRRLQIVVATLAGGVPVLLVTMLAPSCRSSEPPQQPSSPAPLPIDLSGSASDAAAPAVIEDVPPEADAQSEGPPPPRQLTCHPRHVIELPAAGSAAARPSQLCAVRQATVETATAARITLTNYSVNGKTATGHVALPADVEAAVVGMPSISVVTARVANTRAMTATNMKKVAGGFEFSVRWPDLLAQERCFSVNTMTVAATFTVTCPSGGTKKIRALTEIALCDAGNGTLEWVSSGDKCCDCRIIAEMAPSPIVSDKTADDLPLARVVRLRVHELASAGRQVLLFAENDAGPDLEIDWDVSDGSIERIAPDVVLWTLPDDPAETPFGQVAVWTEAGAAVENFAWGNA